SLLGTGVVRVAALEPCYFRALRPEPYRLADAFGAALPGDPDLLLEDQLGGDHEPLLEHGDDQHPVLLAHRRRRPDRAADRHALDADLLPPQVDLGHFLAGVDAGADDHPPALDLALADLEPLLDE